MTTPVPESIALTEYEISNALKVSEQVLRERLKAEIDTLTKARLEYRTANKTEATLKHEADLDLLLQKSIKTCLNSAKDLSKFRLAFFDLFADDTAPRPVNNADMMDCESGEWLRSIVGDYVGLYTVNKILTSKMYEMCFSFNEDKYQCLNIDLPSVAYDIDIPVELLLHLQHTVLPRIEKVEEIENRLKQAKQNLDNIKDTVAKIEARIIVNNLNKNDEGKRVINVAHDIIQEILGESPMLLSLDES